MPINTQFANSERSIAVFLGMQETPSGPPLELYNLLLSLPGHPEGSTVCRQTIEAHGYALPPVGEGAA